MCAAHVRSCLPSQPISRPFTRPQGGVSETTGHFPATIRPLGYRSVMASFDLDDKPGDDVETAHAKRLIRASQAAPADRTPLVVDDETSPADMALLSEVLGGQRVVRRSSAWAWKSEGYPWT